MWLSLALLAILVPVPAQAAGGKAPQPPQRILVMDTAGTLLNFVRKDCSISGDDEGFFFICCLDDADAHVSFASGRTSVESNAVGVDLGDLPS